MQNWREAKLKLKWRLGGNIVLFESFVPAKGGWQQFVLDDLDERAQQQVVEWLTANYPEPTYAERFGGTE